MPTHGYYSAEVLIEGQPAPEYVEEGGGHSVMSNGSHKTVSFIESKTGKGFNVRVVAGNATAQNRILVECFIDGKKAHGIVLANALPYAFEGALSGNDIKSFQFANVKLVSEDTMDSAAAQALLNEQKTKGVEGGQIRVEFWSYYFVRNAPFVPSAAETNEQISIHERAKKGAFLSHTTAYGKAVPSKFTTFAQGSKSGSAPLATLVIEYRSRALLEALSLPGLPAAVAAPPALAFVPVIPVNLGAPANPGGVQQKVKRENEVAVKPEQPAKKYKTSRVGGVLTVDLTDD